MQTKGQIPLPTYSGTTAVLYPKETPTTLSQTARSEPEFVFRYISFKCLIKPCFHRAYKLYNIGKTEVLQVFDLADCALCRV